MMIITFLYDKKSLVIKSVSAGSTKNLPENDGKSKISPFEVFYHDGKKVNPNDFTVCKVNGDCMWCRGISGGNIVFIRNFKPEDKKNIKKGDIVYIKYAKGDYSGYKLREVDEILAHDKEVKTLLYTSEGEIRKSNTNHSIDNIIGIVEMKFE